MFFRLFRRFLCGGSSEGKAPSVTFVWGSPSSGVAERFCTDVLCNYNMTLVASDIDGDITNIKIEVSTDQGNTWNIFQDNIPITTNGFSDNIMTGSKWYRAIVKDSEGHEVISTTLKMTKKIPSLGSIRLVVAGIEYAPEGPVVTPIDVPTGTVDVYLRNIHPSEFISFGTGLGIEPILLHKQGQPTNQIIPSIKPTQGVKLLPGQEALVRFDTGLNTGAYQLSESQIIGQMNGGDLYGTLNWTLNLGGGTINPCRNYKVWAYVQENQDLNIDWIDCNGDQQSISLYTTPGSPGEYLDHVFCARFGTVGTDVGTVEVLGECTN